MSEFDTVALVTGASRGIGASIVSKFRAMGIRTVGAARYKSDNCEYILDVRSEESVRACIESIVDRYGRFDVLVNNAGIVSQSNITDCSLEEWQEVMDTNLRGAFLCSKYSIKYFSNFGGGVIVNISSIAGRLYSLTASEAYTCSKYGLIGLTRQLAQRYADKNIRVNCVCPSQALTSMLKETLTKKKIDEISHQKAIGRLAYPDEIANAVFFLATNSSYISGAVLDINGGG